MTKARSNAVAAAAKGDLTVGTGTNLSGILPVSSQNGDTIVADSSTSTGLRWQGSIAAGKNFVINGGFDIWQRGTSFVNPASYFADRWTSAGPSAGINAVTISRETTGVPAGSQYLLRMTSNGASSYCSLNQFIETANVVPLQGKTVTYSFKVRRNATFSNGGILVIINKSSAVDAGTGGTYSGTLAYVSIPLASIPTTAATSTATYYNASVTFDVPNDGTCNSLYLQIAYNGAVASGSILEYAQMQLELGSVPTTFSRTGGTIQGELAACQRYFWRSGENEYIATGSMKSTTNADCVVRWPVTMRTAPSVSAPNGTNLFFVDSSAANSNVSTIGSFFNVTINSTAARTTVSGFTGGQAFNINSNTGGYISASSEL